MGRTKNRSWISLEGENLKAPMKALERSVFMSGFHGLLSPKISNGTQNGGMKHLYKLYGYGLCKGKPTPQNSLIRCSASILGT